MLLASPPNDRLSLAQHTGQVGPAPGCQSKMRRQDRQDSQVLAPWWYGGTLPSVAPKFQKSPRAATSPPRRLAGRRQATPPSR